MSEFLATVVGSFVGYMLATALLAWLSRSARRIRTSEPPGPELPPRAQFTGYQPQKRGTDPRNPPRGGSGVPRGVS